MSGKSNRVLALGIPKLDEGFQGFQGGDFVVLAGRHLCTLLLFLLSVRCQLPFRKGGLNSRAVFIDGGNTFDPYAVSVIAQDSGLKPRSTLEKILISRAFTAYQLAELIFEKLENFLKMYRSKLVVVSDIIGLFLDRDVPEIEGRNIFLEMIHHLLEVASRRRAVVVASYLTRPYSSRSFFLESILFGRAGAVMRFKESTRDLRFTLEEHQNIKSFSIDVLSNAVTMDMFMED
ncbi:MAG: hypothetical protein JSW53_05940 [Candidatus Bathyarchaeota archaeon]|nr:MAG: hypothetical protein JSW53_05940 [Candidatus Bathyarchaeota archaeon]